MLKQEGEVLSSHCASMDGADRLHLDEEIRTRETIHLDRGAGRQFRAEIARPHIGVLGVRVEVGDIGHRLYDAVCARAGGFETGLDILPDLLNLRLHVTLADNIPLLVARELPDN